MNSYLEEDEEGGGDELLYIRELEEHHTHAPRASTGNESNVAQLFVFAGGGKAGMDNSLLDKEKQMSIIDSSSNGSAYTNNALQRDKKTDLRIDKIKKMLAKIGSAELADLQDESNRRIKQMETFRSFSRQICVLDLDSFYASVEIRDRPELASMPVAVGIGMICTSNYVARKYGVRSGMPGFIAKKLCPDLIFLPLNFAKYTLAAEQVREIIRRVDPHFSSYSLDEVIFDLTDKSEEMYCALQAKGSLLSPMAGMMELATESESQRLEQLRTFAEQIVSDIRKQIKVATCGLTASAGIAHNTPLAKICSNLNKPDGQYSLKPLTREHVLHFLSTLTTRQVGGIGRVSEKILAAINVHTMGDALASMPLLLHVFSATTSRFLLSSALGVCEGEGYERKQQNLPDTAVTRRSLGFERTMNVLSNSVAIRHATMQIAQQVAEDMKMQKLFAKTVTLKLKKANFEVTTRSVTRAYYMQSADDLGKAAMALLEAQLEPALSVRLIGVRVSCFRNEIARDNLASAGIHQPIDSYLKASATALSTNLRPTSSETHSERESDDKEHLVVDLRELGSQETDSEDDCNDAEKGGGQKHVVDRDVFDHARIKPEAATDACKRFKVSHPHSSAEETHGVARHADVVEKFTKKQSTQCPICQVVVKGTLHYINMHVDACINSPGLKTIGQYFYKKL